MPAFVQNKSVKNLPLSDGELLWEIRAMVSVPLVLLIRLHNNPELLATLFYNSSCKNIECQVTVNECWQCWAFGNVTGKSQCKRKGKEEYLYSAFCTKVNTKRSGMDHTVLPANNTMPAFPSWAFTRYHHHSNWGSRHPIAAHYSFIDPKKDERLSWPSWLAHSRWFTHISGHPSATGRAQDSESPPAKDRCSIAGPHNQCTVVTPFDSVA